MRPTPTIASCEVEERGLPDGDPRKEGLAVIPARLGEQNPDHAIEVETEVSQAEHQEDQLREATQTNQMNKTTGKLFLKV